MSSPGTGDEALRLLADVAATQSVEFMAGPTGDWEYRDGALINARTDFFRVVAREREGREELLFRQDEVALVGLLVTRGPRGRRLLLSARAEPGLHGGCQFSTTIQSTPSNYERRHGGAPTPRLDDVLDPPVDSRVVHDSQQYDWAQFYHRKVKRFRIVELADEGTTPDSMLWLDVATVRDFASRDHTLSCDLQIALTLLDISDQSQAVSAVPKPDGVTVAPAHDVAIEGLRDWRIAPDGIRSSTRDREIAWVRTRSTTREVRDWVQPIMRLTLPSRIQLAARAGASGPEIAMTALGAAGLDGERLWYPAGGQGATGETRTTLSAEGGRFWRHQVEASVLWEAQAESGARWFALADVEEACRLDTRTSVELRLAVGAARRSWNERG